MFQSQDVARAIYFTPWYRFPYQLKRSLNIITMRSQKPAQLTAGYIIPLSLQTFASVRMPVVWKTWIICYVIISRTIRHRIFRWCHPRHPFSPWYVVWIDSFIDVTRSTYIFMYRVEPARLLMLMIVRIK
jgi:hypothetical protein